MDLKKLTIVKARALMDNKELTALELTKAYLARIKEIDPKLNACLEIFTEDALGAARNADLRIAKGEKSPLLGIPCLVKDNIMTKGHKTTASSLMLKDYEAAYDAAVITKLKSSGAVILGKTNLDEFAHGSSTESSAFFTTKNPYDKSRVPGGSSGGSAAAVAAGLCLFALGSETGGSIRQPAAFCGLSGFKPSYGGISRYGLIAMTSSNDVIGVLAKTSEEIELVFRQITGRDIKDSTSVDIVEKSLNKKEITIGIPEEYFPQDLAPEIKNKISLIQESMEAMEIKFKTVSLPSTKYSTAVYYIITPAEISSNLARLDGLRYGYRGYKLESNWSDFLTDNRGGGFGEEAKRRIMLGTYVLSAGYFDAYYKKAEKVRELIKQDFSKVFSEVDFLLTPTTPHTAFKIGEKKDPLSLYLEDIFLSAASLAGLPAMSCQAGLLNELPVGFQLIAPQGADYELLGLVKKFQAETDYQQNYPKI